MLTVDILLTYPSNLTSSLDRLCGSRNNIVQLPPLLLHHSLSALNIKICFGAFPETTAAVIFFLGGQSTDVCCPSACQQRTLAVIRTAIPGIGQCNMGGGGMGNNAKRFYKVSVSVFRTWAQLLCFILFVCIEQRRLVIEAEEVTPLFLRGKREMKIQKRPVRWNKLLPNLTIILK